MKKDQIIKAVITMLIYGIAGGLAIQLQKNF